MDDGDALIALDGVLTSYAVQASGTSADPGPLGAWAARVDEILGGAGGRSVEEDPEVVFWPFGSSADAVVLLDQIGAVAPLRMSRDVRNTATYAAAVSAMWAAPAGRCRRDHRDAGHPDRGGPGHPSGSRGSAQRSAPVAQAQTGTGAGGGRQSPGAKRLRRPLAGAPERPRIRGALLELRAESVDLADDLNGISIPKHKLISKLSDLGVTDAILIDQNPARERLRRLQGSVDEWITAALAQAGRAPGDESLAHQVDRIAVTLGALRTRLAIIEVTERTIEAGEVGLHEDLEPQASTLDTALVFLELEKDFEHVKSVVTTASSQASTLATS